MNVAIIGNSFLGAVVKAAAQDPSAADGLALTFGAAGGVNFKTIDVVDGRFVNLRSDGTTTFDRVDAYDAVVIYGLFPYPAEIVRMHRKLIGAGYSQAVSDAAIDDYLAASDAWVVFRRIRAATAAPVWILSGNERSDVGLVTAADRARGADMIARFTDGIYVPPPGALVTEDGTADQRFYKGSFDILGRLATDEATQRKWDLHHFNIDGGRVMLDAIVRRLRA